MRWSMRNCFQTTFHIPGPSGGRNIIFGNVYKFRAVAAFRQRDRRILLVVGLMGEKAQQAGEAGMLQGQRFQGTIFRLPHGTRL